MAKQKTEAQIDRYSRYGAPFQWILATAIGVGSASTTFVNLVRTKFHQDAEFRQGFSLINLHKNYELKELTDKHIEGVVGLLEKELGHTEEFNKFCQARDDVNKLAKNGLEATKISTKAYNEAAFELFEKYGEQIDKINNSKLFQQMREHFITTGKAIKVAHDDRVDRYSERVFGIFSKNAKGHVLGSWQRFKNFSNYAQRNMVLKTAAAFGVAFGGTMMVFNQLNTRDKLNEIDKQSESADRKLDALLAKADIGEHEIETRAEHRAHVREKEKADDRALRAKGGHVSKVKESRLEAETSYEHASVDADEQHAHLGSHTRALAESRAEASQELAV